MARELQCHGHSHKGIAKPELSHNTMFYNEVFANLMALTLEGCFQRYLATAFATNHFGRKRTVGRRRSIFSAAGAPAAQNVIPERVRYPKVTGGLRLSMVFCVPQLALL